MSSATREGDFAFRSSSESSSRRTSSLVITATRELCSRDRAVDVVVLVRGKRIGWCTEGRREDDADVCVDPSDEEEHECKEC